MEGHILKSLKPEELAEHCEGASDSLMGDTAGALRDPPNWYVYAIGSTARKASTTAPLAPQQAQPPGAWLSPGTSSAPLNPQTGGSHVRVPLRGKTAPLLCAPSPSSYPEPFPAPADDPAPNPSASSPAAAPGDRDAQGQRVRPAPLLSAGGRTDPLRMGWSGTASGMSSPASPGAERRLYR